MNDPEDITTLEILEQVGRAHGIEAPRFFEQLHRELNALGRINARRFAKAENERLTALLEAIADEAQQHYEHNPFSKVDRLPLGYTKILSLASAAVP